MACFLPMPHMPSHTEGMRGQDSPLKADVVFSRAWHTANKRPVGERKERGKSQFSIQLLGFEGTLPDR